MSDRAPASCARWHSAAWTSINTSTTGQPGDWARADAAPSQEQIQSVRRLLRANDEVLAALEEKDRAAVEEAITAIRTQRASLNTTFPLELRGLTGPHPPVFFPTIEYRAASADAAGKSHT